MSLSDLYQEVILDHNRAPRNYGALASPTHSAVGHNPLCGDRLRVMLRLEADRIADVAFEGAGCAISKASASLMTDAIKGRSVAAADALFDRVHAMLTGPGGASETDPDDVDGLGKLEALAGVRQFPVRIKCATLAWHTLKAALAGEGAEVRTE
jgi:nitrogen fixation NifU-like protein